MYNSFYLKQKKKKTPNKLRITNGMNGCSMYDGLADQEICVSASEVSRGP